MLFDTLSRLPDLVASSVTLQDGWVAAFEPSGRLRSALSLGASRWAEITAVASRGSALVAAGMADGVVTTSAGILGTPQTRSAVIVRIADPTMQVAAEPADASHGPIDAIWSLDGRHVGTDPRRLSPGVYVARRSTAAPFLLHVGIDGP
jgi:hypothetical protein